MLKVEEIKIFDDLSEEEVIQKALKKVKIAKDDVKDVIITKKSIDARDKNNVHYSYSFLFEVKDENKYSYLTRQEKKKEEPIIVRRKSKYQPIIIGTGPAGLFCGYTLAKNGVAPIMIEQGDCVENRINDVHVYKTTGKLNPNCNVQFGEGGAGTFSDGKLTTGINSLYIDTVLRTFYEFGAPKEITYLSKPHIGTDNLVKIVSNIRKFILSKGGSYHFNTKFVDYNIKNGIITVFTSKGEFQTDCLVLAIGHSARDTFKMLQKHNVSMQRKNFSVGLRIEHKQKMIDESQYGNKTKLKLPAAQYKLAYHGKERSCYSFCMCPGGEVMASSSEPGRIVTNGMSEFARDKENSNAAILVNVLTTDFEGNDPLKPMEFQDELEQAAFKLAGSNNNAPVQLVKDFEEGKPSTKIGSITPSYKPGYTLCDLNEILPKYVSDTIKEALPYFDKKIKGFNSPDAVLTGVETRTSCPLTILRNEEMVTSEGIYPIGEGAGYAGGITSAAVDGIKTAIKILEKN